MATNNIINTPQPFAITAGGTGVASVTTAPTASAWSGWDANKNHTANNHIASYTTTAPTASAWSGWDANKNHTANNHIASYTTTATAAGTTVLTVGSTWQQFFTGSTTQTVTLPVTSTLVLGQSFYIVNNSTGNVTVNSSGNNAVQVMAGSTTLLVTCILTSGTTAASWSIEYVGETSGGTVNAGTVNQLAWYAATGNAVSGLATSASGVLVTSAGSVPSISTTLPSAISASSMILTSPKIITSILDTNGNILVNVSPIASAVNYVQIQNNATGANPVIFGTGSDTNVALQLTGKGNLGVQVQGTSTNNNAPNGYMGEYISSSVLVASAVSLSTGTSANITSISLTAGDWDVMGTGITTANAATVTTQVQLGISTTSATLPTAGAENNTGFIQPIATAGTNVALVAGQMRISISATTTVYLVISANFSVNTLKAYGFIGARRVR